MIECKKSLNAIILIPICSLNWSSMKDFNFIQWNEFEYFVLTQISNSDSVL